MGGEDTESATAISIGAGLKMNDLVLEPSLLLNDGDTSISFKLGYLLPM